LLWRSAPASSAPNALPDHTEFPVGFAMPEDFPRELEMDETSWRRYWHITVKVAPDRYFNFDLDVPLSQAASIPGLGSSRM
jgi:hypothetical protein